jgi:hypothetical protein
MEKKQGTFIYGIVLSGTIDDLRKLLLHGADADEVEIIIDKLIKHGVKEQNVGDIKTEKDIAQFVAGMGYGRRMTEEINEAADLISDSWQPNQKLFASQKSKTNPGNFKAPDLFYIKRDGLYLQLFMDKLQMLAAGKGKMKECYTWGEKKLAFMFASLEAFELIEDKIMCGRNVELVKAD